MKSHTGHTLMELMVAMAIFGLILSSIFNIFVPGVRTFMVGKERVATQANVMISLKRIRMELCSTSNSSITINSAEIYSSTGEPDAISFLSPYSDTERKISLDSVTSTLPIWQKYVIYFHDRPSRELRRKVVKLTEPGPLAIALDHDKLYDLCLDNDNYPYSIVSRDIHKLSICRTSPYLVKIHINSRKKAAGFVGSQEQESECFMEIYPHNTLN